MTRTITKVGTSIANVDATYSVTSGGTVHRFASTSDYPTYEGNRLNFCYSNSYSFLPVSFDWPSSSYAAQGFYEGRYWQFDAQTTSSGFPAVLGGSIQYRRTQELSPDTPGELTPAWESSGPTTFNTFRIPWSGNPTLQVQGPNGVQPGKDASGRVVAIGKISAPGWAESTWFAGYRVTPNIATPPSVIYAFPTMENLWDANFPLPQRGYGSAGQNWVHLPNPDSSDRMFTLAARWTDGTKTAYSRILIDWLQAGSAASTEYFTDDLVLSDPADQAYFTTMADAISSEAAGNPPSSRGFNVAKFAVTNTGVFVSINIVVDGNTVRKFYQINPDFTEYREIVLRQDGEPFLNMNTTSGVFISQATDGYITAVVNTGFSDMVYVFPDDPPTPEPEPISGDTYLRSWTFTLDGHEFYVMKLGRESTVVYDLSTEQWHEWASSENPVWAVASGMFWQGGEGKAETNNIVGDVNNGDLYFLEPTLPYDQTRTGPEYFERLASTFISVRGRQSVDCNNVYLSCDLNGVDEQEVSLLTSDDAGQTFMDHGGIPANVAAQEGEYAWRSLGQMSAPGRIFQIRDFGAVQRLDGLEVNDGSE